MSGPPDRRAAVASSATCNGIDHVQLGPGGATLTVFFLNPRVDLSTVVIGATLTGGSTTPSVAVRSLQPDDWHSAPRTLTLHVTPPGDSSTYTLRLTPRSPASAGSPILDPYFAHAEVSFAAGTPTTVDCEAPPPAAPTAATNAPPIDYLAKDFGSFRNALLGFSALRYPAWQERSEADFGVMFLEALCSLADDFSYQQDRIAAEAYLDTATERRSLVRHARLADYEPQPALSASVVLQFTVKPGVTTIPAGLAVSADRPDGITVAFETGASLADVTGAVAYVTSSAWNDMTSYVWDATSPILPAGATEVWIVDDATGAVASSLHAGVSLLLDTPAADPAQASVRQIVELVSVGAETDPLNGEPLVHVVWRPEDALTQARDLGTTKLRGNLVPATQGLHRTESFAVDPGSASALPRAVLRTGPNQTAQYLYTLGNAQLAWLPADDPSTPFAPEIQVSSGGAPWSFARWLLDAGPFDATFTLDPTRYAPLGVELAGGAVNPDYDGSSGWTVRFGDDTFGQIPASGSAFQVVYRAGGGAAGNVAADAITGIDPSSPLASDATAVTNPFPAAGGADAQTADSVRQLAPQAYKGTQLTAALPADFAAAAQTLPWVARAGSASRYTGSWLTTFTAPDPVAASVVTRAQALALTTLLDRAKLAGRESVVLSPSYVSLDLQIVVGARADAFRSDVQATVLQALGTGTFPDGSTGFFQHGRFTFGTPLLRSALEAAIQGAHGVTGVVDIRYRRSRAGGAYAEMPAQIGVGAGGIIQVDNDPRRPDAGSLVITVQGGK